MDADSMHKSPESKIPFNKVAGSTIPLAYPWEGHNFFLN